MDDNVINIPLIGGLSNRDRTGLTDARMINCYAELDPETKDWWIYRRPGLSAPVLTQSGGGRGVYFWQPPGGAPSLISIAGTTVYNGTLGATLGTILGGAPTYFQPMRTSPPALVFGDGSNAYVIQSSTVTKITDANFPTIFAPGWAYLDGTLYVMDYAGKIYGSNIDDPFTWNALNNLTADVEPSGGVTLTKYYAYVIAIKTDSAEVFYDADNTTGTPLAPVQGAFINYGCMDGATLQKFEGILFWVTRTAYNIPQVIRVDNLQPTIISTPPVERLLAGSIPGAWQSLAIRLAGHRWYIVTNINLNLTLAYDIDQQRWYRWTDVTGAYWPIGSIAGGGIGSPNIAQDYRAANATLSVLDSQDVYSTENGAAIPVDIYTRNLDFDTDKVKQLALLRIHADRLRGSTLTVRWSDDDYQTWSNPVPLDLGKERPIITDLGSFYRRAFRFTNTDYMPMRLRAASLHLGKGTL